MITDAANEVSAQAKIVADLANTASESEQIKALDILTGNCERLEEAITNVRSSLIGEHRGD